MRFYLQGRLTEWGTDVRRYLVQVAAQQYQVQLSKMMTQQETQRDADGGLTDERAKRRSV